MTQKLYTPEQVAEYLSVTPNKVACLLRSKQLNCLHIGHSKRVTEGHIQEYIKLAGSRPPRKRRPRPQIPLELSPIWQQLVDVALANHPHLAPFMSDATLTSIDAKKRTAFVIANTEAAATVLMAEPNRYAIQRGLRTIFRRPLVVCVSCSK